MLKKLLILISSYYTISSIKFIKSYLYSRCEKKTKFTSRLIRYFNICKNCSYLIALKKI